VAAHLGRRAGAALPVVEVDRAVAVAVDLPRGLPAVDPAFELRVEVLAVGALDDPLGIEAARARERALVGLDHRGAGGPEGTDRRGAPPGDAIVERRVGGLHAVGDLQEVGEPEELEQVGVVGEGHLGEVGGAGLEDRGERDRRPFRDLRLAIDVPGAEDLLDEPIDPRLVVRRPGLIAGPEERPAELARADRPVACPPRVRPDGRPRERGRLGEVLHGVEDRRRGRQHR